LFLRGEFIFCQVGGFSFVYGMSGFAYASNIRLWPFRVLGFGAYSKAVQCHKQGSLFGDSRNSVANGKYVAVLSVELHTSLFNNFFVILKKNVFFFIL
jgi:hypothetical protein